MTFGLRVYEDAFSFTLEPHTMLVKLAPPTVADLLKNSAWFPLLDESAQRRILDDLREVEVRIRQRRPDLLGALREQEIC